MISFPDIPARAVSVSTSDSYLSDLPIYSAISGERYTRARITGTAATSNTIDFLLDSGVTASSDHIIIAHADQLIDHPTYADITEVYVQSDTSSGFGSATTVHSNTSFNSSTLYGPDSSDYIATWSAATARRYWRVKFTNPSDSKLDLSKIYLGTFFDMGIDPTSYSIDPMDKPPYLSRNDSGSLVTAGRKRPRYKVSVGWEGVTDTIAQSFSESILKIQHKHQGVFLYAPTVTQLLDGFTLLHCKLTNRRISSSVPDWNYISCEFEEMEG